MKPEKRKKVSQLRRKKRVRRKISGTAQRPRLSVFRSSKHIYAQLIDDEKGITVAAASTLSPELQEVEHNGKKSAAEKVGKLIADKAKKIELNSIVFDRNGKLYHGRIKALAEAARENGLKF